MQNQISKIPKQGQCIPVKNHDENEHAYQMRCAAVRNETDGDFQKRFMAASAKFREVEEAYKRLEKHLAPK